MTQSINRLTWSDPPKRIKELMALVVAVYAHCEGCIVFHVNTAIAEGASREELSEALAVVAETGGGAATVYGAMALSAFDELRGGAR